MSWEGWTERFAAAERRLGIRRTAMVCWAMWMTWECFSRGLDYVQTLGNDAPAIMAAATVLGALQLPITALAGVVARDYFRDKREPPPPPPPATSNG